MPKTKREHKYTTIEDSVIEPYYIKIDDTGSTVFNREKTNFRSYHVGFEDALTKISKLKTQTITEEQTLTIKEYMDTYAEITKQIKDAFQS